MIEIVAMTPEEFTVFDNKWNNVREETDKIARRTLGEGRPIIIRWGYPCLGLKVDGEILSINVTSFSKRPRKNAWGRYLNFYIAYTVPAHRHKGYATQLATHIEQIGIDGGWDRIKSLAGSYGGVRLHMGMGHHFYGIGKGGALVMDSPLKSGEVWPDTLPIEARNACPAHAPVVRRDERIAARRCRREGAWQDLGLG